MSNLWKGLTYSYHRNIGWQDRTLRTIFGLFSLAGAIYFFYSNFSLSVTLGTLFLAQVITVISSQCPICYFLKRCTITDSEKKSLIKHGVPFEQ